MVRKFHHNQKLLEKISEANLDDPNFALNHLPLSIIDSVSAWRRKKTFSLVSKTFRRVKATSDLKKKFEKKNKKFRKMYTYPVIYENLCFLEVNIDVLSMVFTFI